MLSLRLAPSNLLLLLLVPVAMALPSCTSGSDSEAAQRDELEGSDGGPGSGAGTADDDATADDDDSADDDDADDDDSADDTDDDATGDDDTVDTSDDDVASDDDASSDDDVAADDDAQGPVLGDRCPAGCPVPSLCQLCDDGSCARAEVACNDDGSCGALSWVCDSAPVAPKPPADCDIPGRRYVADSPDQCAVIRYACDEGETAFSDECGCGCIEAASGDECADVERNLLGAWNTIAECRQDSDCIVRYNALCGASTPALGDVGCFLPVNDDSDDTELEALEAQAVECGLATADCDCASLPPAACVDGSCVVESDLSLCESTGGTWQEGSCGHYACGQQPPCRALIPGCDCGASANFVQSEGCVTEPDCAGE